MSNGLTREIIKQIAFENASGQGFKVEPRGRMFADLCDLALLGLDHAAMKAALDEAEKWATKAEDALKGGWLHNMALMDQLASSQAALDEAEKRMTKAEGMQGSLKSQLYEANHELAASQAENERLREAADNAVRGLEILEDALCKQEHPLGGVAIAALDPLREALSAAPKEGA